MTTSSLSASRSGGTRARIACAELGPVGVAVHLPPGRLANPRLRGVRAGDDRVEARAGEGARGGERRHLERRLHAGELGLEARQRLAEETERLEEPRHVAADALGRDEVDDLDREAAADAVEPPDALLGDERAPGQVEQDDAAAELEVPALSTALGRDEEARPAGQPELGHLDVAPRRGQLLVEHPGRDLGAAAELGADPLQRLAVGDEDERLLPGLAPPRGVPGQPRHAGVGRVRPLREAREVRVVAAEESLERGAGGERAAHAIRLLPPTEGVGRRGSAHGADQLQPRRPAALALGGQADAGRQPADVHASRRAGAGREGLGPREAGLEGLGLREIGRDAAAGAGGRSRARRRRGGSR